MTIKEALHLDKEQRKKRASFRFTYNLLSIHYDWVYGIDKRFGWSIAWNDSFVVQFERFLAVALWKAYKDVRSWEE